MATKIVGIDGMTLGQLDQQVAAGGQFVYYQYTISIIVMTFRRGSDIFFIAPGESHMAKSWPYSLVTLLLGWWGIPWGPIYSVGSLVTNFGGGKIVTEEVLYDLFGAAAEPAVPATRIEHGQTGYIPPEDR
jgi:hypothetical protein